MRLIFMGTPEFSLPALNALIESNHQILAIVTTPDRLMGRGQKIQPSPVKKKALEVGLPLLQPESLSENIFLNEVKKFNPEIIVVVAFGKLIPKNLIELPEYGCLNLHPSLLPSYRGAAPIHRAIIDGREFTGITVISLSEEMDAGEIYLQKKIKIESEDTYATLSRRLSISGAQLVIEALQKLSKGNLKSISQDESKVTFAPKISKEECEINWDSPSQSIYNLIRGLNPIPGAYTYYQKKRIKIFKAEFPTPEEIERILESTYQDKKIKPGTAVALSKNKGFIIRTKSNGLWITELQPEGKQKISGQEFLRGYRLSIGDIFG